MKRLTKGIKNVGVLVTYSTLTNHWPTLTELDEKIKPRSSLNGIARRERSSNDLMST